MRTRIRVAISVVALVVTAALFIGTPGAIGVTGDFVKAGYITTSTFRTTLTRTDYFSQSDCDVNTLYYGFVACSRNGIWGKGTVLGVKGEAGENGTAVFGDHDGLNGIGVWGQTNGHGSGVFGEATGSGVGVFGKSTSNTGVYGTGNTTGVYGIGTNTGVEGSASAGGTGVYGHNAGSTGIGVHGQTGGSGSAVFGEATSIGVGVFGRAPYATALRSDSANGIALQVNGKAKFSRSGIATVAAGASSLNVSLPGVTTSSMVIATAQQNGNVSVKAAVPSGGSFKLFLTGNAPAGGLKVAYFVLN
jgi:hypothetical protein